MNLLPRKGLFNFKMDGLKNRILLRGASGSDGNQNMSMSDTSSLKQPAAFYSVGKGAAKNYSYGPSESSESRWKDKLSNLDYKKLGKIVGVILVVVLVIWVIGSVVGNSDSGDPGYSRVQVQGAKATLDLGKEFSFPILEASGEEVGRITFNVESAELKDEIIIKGQRATAVEGRTFLVINLKLKNDFEQPIEMDTRDYIRLKVNGNGDDLLAPDIHNDPVEVQAISSKQTRVGFPIDDNNESMILVVGEIGGDKEEVLLEF